MDNAARYNAGKPELMELPFDCLEEVSKVLTQAKAKYPNLPNGKPNWSKLWGEDTIRVCMNSLLRHASKIQQGEIVDKESGQLHASHIVCNALFMIRHELEKRGDNK